MAVFSQSLARWPPASDPPGGVCAKADFRGPRGMMQDLGSGALESAFGRPQVTLACIKV